MSDSDSDYVVEEYIKPEVVRNTYKNEDPLSEVEQESESEESEEENVDDSAAVKKSQCVLNGNKQGEDHDEEEQEPPRTNNRYILYVTNLSGETTKSMLEAYFGDAGEIKAIRIPKVRLGNFAFVEMKDFEGFKVS